MLKQINPCTVGKLAIRVSGVLQQSRLSIAAALQKRNSWPTERGLSVTAQVRVFCDGHDYYVVHDRLDDIAAALKAGASEVDVYDPAAMNRVAAYFDQKLKLFQEAPPTRRAPSFAM